jgi:hypothetical protein
MSTVDPAQDADTAVVCHHHRNEQLPEEVGSDGLRWLWFRCLDCGERWGEPCPCCDEQFDGPDPWNPEWASGPATPVFGEHNDGRDGE